MNTPVLFIVFNRPDTTQEVFNVIRKVKPKKLFISADGARNSSELTLCDKTREIIKQVDWDCEVMTLFQETNLGCKLGVSTAINWFFNNVDEGIILEDDCLPSKSFFTFCEYMLNKYRYDDEVMHIGGVNFLPEMKESYYFSRYNCIWGWATWKRAWEKYDVNMQNFPKFKEEKLINRIFSNKIIKLYWMSLFSQAFKNKIDTWDYQWTFAVWNNNGISILPGVNLISNIGFDERATHTKSSESKLSKLPKGEFDSISELTNKSINKENDRKLFEIISGLKLSLNVDIIIFLVRIFISHIKNF